MGESGRKYVLAHFSRDQRAAQLSEILDALHTCQGGCGAEANVPLAKTAAERERSNRVATETRNY
jgi:hypothetical protein